MQVDTREAADWWAQPRGAASAEWVRNYQHSLQARHRTVIAEQVTALQPATVLEVGCHCGPNVIRLAASLPTTRFRGLDVNAEAIQAGRAWAVSAGCADRVHLETGQIPDALLSLPTGCTDVVLTCYALAYIAPHDLDAVLFELGRIARRAVVIAEPMTAGAVTRIRAMSGYSEWAHNYLDAHQWINTWRGMTTAIIPVAPPVDRLNGVLVARRADN
jgi:ubiquinone/menaquinone biosynthesis C-methylase UbiE